MAQTSIAGWKCEICEHEWKSRTDAKPVRCAHCKSPYWDRKRLDGHVGRVDEVGASKRGGVRATVPVVREAKGKAKRLHEMQHVRGELVIGGGLESRPEGESHEGHRTNPNGDKTWCSTCRVNF